MAKTHKVGTPYTISYDTAGTQTGLVDLRCDFYNPDQIAFPHDPLVDFVILAEIGTTGVYEGAFTPAQVGSWKLLVGSVSAVPLIEGKAGRLDVVLNSDEDRDGAGFNSATDSQAAIRAAVDGVSANIAAISRGGLMM